MAVSSHTATRSRAAASACPTHHPGLALPGLLVLLAAGCAGAPAPAPTPTPTPRPPAEQAPAGTPRVEEPAPLVRRGEVGYAAGAFTYDVTSEASIELLRDSTFVRPTPLVDTLVTTASLSYQIADEGGGVDRLVTGSVDSFTVRSTGLVPGVREPYAAAVPFRAMVLGGRMPAQFASALPVPSTPQSPVPAAADSSCVAPDAPLIALARDVLAPLPFSVAPGHAWQDTVSTTTCRAGIPVTTTAVRSYRVVGPGERDGVPALSVSRATQITMTGQGTPRGQAVTVLGGGQGAGALFLDVAGGRYLGGVDSSTVELTISNGIQTRRFVQQARQETRLRRN